MLRFRRSPLCAVDDIPPDVVCLVRERVMFTSAILLSFVPAWPTNAGGDLRPRCVGRAVRSEKGSGSRQQDGHRRKRSEGIHDRQ